MTEALVVVDVQNDFAHPEGSLFVEGGNRIAKEINKIQKHFDIIVFTRDWHPAVTEHFVEHGGPWPAHCIAGTWGANFVDDLEIPAGSGIVVKGTDPGADGYSGFSVERDGQIERTSLHAMLQDQDVSNVFVAGIALDVCVKATCLDAVKLGYRTYLYIDATAAVTEDGGEKAKQELREAGVIFI